MTAGMGNGRIETMPQNPDHRDGDANRARTDPSPILVTKLFIPPPRRGAIARPRLIERLNEGLDHKLTLISAPAGFGKTTLLAEWLAATERPTAWVSLDQADEDTGRFWAYVIAALQTIRPDVGANVLALLQSPQPPPIESILASLINEITTIESDFALVLDDFHTIDAPPVHSAVAFLLDHLPPRMHLVIASRSDPSLPLARLRVRGESTELRAADLRFTHEEAAAFLNAAMGLDLSAADLATLETRTEGWIAGLQLAALSMRGRTDVSGFIRAFAGGSLRNGNQGAAHVAKRTTSTGPKLVNGVTDRLDTPRFSPCPGNRPPTNTLVPPAISSTTS